jgi:hypothetical protein
MKNGDNFGRKNFNKTVSSLIEKLKIQFFEIRIQHERKRKLMMRFQWQERFTEDLA